MGYWALVISVLLYAIVSLDLAMKKKYAMAIIFFSYAIANIAYVYIAYRDKVE